MLEGEISQINLVERLVELWREQFTGAIRFESDGIIKILYFKGGDVLSASTNDRADSIDEILMRAGKVSREHVKQALAKRKENETLGDALLNLGFITRKELTWARRVQVVGVIRSISEWQTGSFTIVADYLPKRDEGTLFPLPQIIVELVVTDQDRGKFERLLDGGNAVFIKSVDFDAVWRDLGLNEDAEAIAAEIDGERNASEISVLSGKETFNVYKLLHGLATLGVITHRSKAQASPQFSLDDFSAAGVADAADMWGGAVAEASTPVAPTFELDDAALGGPTLSIEPEGRSRDLEDDFVPAPPQIPPASWDEPAAVTASAAARATPAWEPPVRPSAPPPATKAVPPPLGASEEQWGFDDAQIETVRRSGAIEPPPPMALPAAPVLTSAALKRGKVQNKPSGRSYGLIVALMVVFILAAAGYFGFLWWQGRGGDVQTPVAAARPVIAPQPTTAATGSVEQTNTIVELSDTAVTASVTDSAAVSVPTTTTSPDLPLPVVTAKAAAPPAPTVITPAPAPAPVRTAAGRERYDAMAREYAANPTGNFSIQIQILCDPANLDKIIKTGGADIWFVPQPLGARSCYRVYYGRYSTREQAQQALSRVPASIRDRSSAVKPISR